MVESQAAGTKEPFVFKKLTKEQIIANQQEDVLS